MLYLYIDNMEGDDLVFNLKYKKIVMFFLITISFFIGINVDALSMGRVNNQSGATVRTGPGTNYDKVSTLSYFDTVPLISSTKETSEKGCTSNWYKINYNGVIGYVCSNYVSTSNITLKVNSTDGVNIRNGAGTDYPIYKHLDNNKSLSVYSSTKVSGSGCSKGWYKISYDASNSKYICSDYIDNYNAKSNIIITKEDGAVVRSSAKSTSSAISTLKYGQVLTLSESKTYKGTGCTGGYYKVFYKGYYRYICSYNVLNTKSNGTVNNTYGVNVRTGPGAGYKKITNLKFNSNVSLVDTTKYDGTGCSSGWYKVKLNGNYRYVCSSYVSTSSLATTTVGASSINIRNGAGTGYSIFTTLNKNINVILYSTTKHKGTGCSDGWYKIYLNGSARYICSTYTKLGKDTKTNSNNSSTTNEKTLKEVTINSSTSYYTTNKWTYKINENYATVRKTAGGDFKEYIYLGTEVKPISTSGSYTKISYYNGRTGWIFTRLIDKYSDVTKNDSTYCTKLKNAGFPESYCPYLSYLHSKHPNWIFKAEKTGDNFANAVKNESEKNYTQINISAYIASSDIKEDDNWRAASDAYTAYMLDPRNYLSERNIYVFENLSYDKENHTASAIRSILGDSYLASKTYHSDGYTYVGYFLRAASLYDISPLHLAARVKQEGGTNEDYAPVSGNVTTKWNTRTGYVCSSYVKLNSGNTSGTVTGSNGANLRTNAGSEYSLIRNIKKGDTFTLSNTTKYTGTGCSNGWYKVSHGLSLKGIYNYYNIGAYGDNPTIRGLAAAAGYVDDLDDTPWNTRRKAIIYGARFIANGYINKGQDTLFYQKFNVGPNAPVKYTHQYMTNIIAPASESLSTYYSNDDLGITDKAFVFKIPVYESMPTNPTSHPPVGSTSAHLDALK